MKTKKLLLILSILLGGFSYGQNITVENVLTPEELVQNVLVGSGVTISNVEFNYSVPLATSVQTMVGFFDGVGTSWALDSGLVIATGNCALAAGDPTEGNTLGNATDNSGVAPDPNDPDLDAIGTATINNEAILEFDFIPEGDSVVFNYIFASEEYNEYVGSAFNDVFGFFISGPGITGPYTDGAENIALIPGTSTPVAINNVNNGPAGVGPCTNCPYWVNNPPVAGPVEPVEYDAHTTVLQAASSVICGETYHIKICIGDAGDTDWDSAVFLEASSFSSNGISVSTETVLADGIGLEGCTPATFTFSLENPSDEDTEICYDVLGTATNGIDYEYIDTCITIPSGSTEATIVINAISDGFAEGSEYVYIIYQVGYCSEIDTAILEIQDSDPITFSLDGTDLDCFEDASGVIDVDASGGYPPYTYYVTDDGGAGTTTTYTSDPITGMDAGTYSVQVYDSYGCFAQALVVGGSFDADTTFLPDGTGDTYSTTIDISGFGPTETLDDMSQLQQICMTMEHSYLGDLEIEIVAPSGEAVILKQYPGGGSCDLGEPYASGPVDGDDSDLTDPGTGFEYCFNDMPIFGTMVDESDTYTHTIPASTGGDYTDNYLPSGSYTSFEALSGLLGASLDGTWTLNVTDNLALDNGYIFNWNIALISDLPDTLVVIEEPDEIVIDGFITEATCGGSDGSINISVSGAYPPFTYLWSNGETTEDITGLSAGTYTVYVTDDNGCTDSLEFILNNTSSINITTVVTTASCIGSTDGAIDVTTSGGTPPYSYSWSSGPTTEDLSGVTAGTYTLTITDAVGCIYSEDITIPSLPPITIGLASLQNEECGTENGAINITVTGGSGSYGFDWDTGDDTEDISGLSAGDYSVTVTDANGCTASEMYTLINDVSACSEFCYLDAEAVITDEECGNGLGALDVTVTDATFPYTVVWGDGETTEDLINLSAGDYTITINDANGCEHIETFTVGNETYTLDLSSSTISDENCGNGDGSIDITVVGGTLVYTYLWSTGATTEDISGLSAGTYSVEVTDGNGCSFETSFVVSNNTGTMDYTAVVANEICGSGNGGINLTVTGAVLPISYAWSSGPTSEDLSGLSAGTYSCIVTDGSGCTMETEEFTILNGAGTLDILSIVTANENCDNDMGSIDLTIIGGSAPYSYSWSTAATTEDVSGLSEGTYDCTITDDIGCTVSTGDIVIYNAPGDLDVEVDIVTDEVCGNGEGAIFVTTSGGTAPYAYSWSDASTSEDNTDLSAGSYTLTVTDDVGCTIEITETVDNTPGSLDIDNAVVTDEVCGNGAGAIDMVISGGTAPYTYSWSTAATTEDISSLSAGSYDFTVTDANGCEQEMTVEVVNEAGDLAQSFVATTEMCSGANGAIDLSVTGGTAPYTYLWNTSATTQDLSGLSAGTYSCTITDDAGCSITTGDIVIANNPGTLDVASSSTDESCGDGAGAIDLTVTGGTSPYTFLWSTTETTEDISGLSAGTYTYTVTDDAGCVVTADVEIENNTGTLAIDDMVVTDENCDDDLGAIDITISGGTGPYSYLWNTAATTEDLSGLNEGTYSCTVTDASGCEVSTGDLIVSNNAGDLTLLDVNVTDETCGIGNGSINITVSGGTDPLSYLWSTSATTEDLISLSEGTYSCTVTDAAGCELDVTATVLNDAGTLNISASSVTDENCSAGDGAVDITVSGGIGPYTYTWSNAATTQDITGVSAGTYTVVVDDAIGCSVNQDFTVEDDGGDLAITGGVIGDEICGNEAGSVDISFVGGTAPVTFAWDNGDETEDLSGVAAGDYTVILTDINGCTVSGDFTVGDDNGDLEITSTVVTDESCGDGAGAIDITYTGGSSPFTFDWDNGDDTEDISGLSAGDYSLVLTDINGCTVSTSGTVDNISGGFDATIDLVTDESCGDGAGAIDVTVVGGTAPYSYTWDSGPTTEDISGLSAGDYELTVTDDIGCSVVISATVENISGSFAVTAELVEDENCDDGTGFIDITVGGGSAPYTYLWNTSATTEDISGLSAGIYTCTITDNVGCVINYEAEVENTAASLEADVEIGNELCGNGEGYIEVTASGGINPYTFSWTGASPSECCTWALEMFDTGTSWNTATVTVEIDGAEIGEFTVLSGGYNYEEFEVCDGETIELIWDGGFFDGEVSFDLLDSDGSVVFSQGPDPADGSLYVGTGYCPAGDPSTTALYGLSAGDYELTITDDVGCTLTETYTVVDIASDISIDIVSTTDEFCDGNNGVIEYTLSGGTGPFTTTANGFTDGPPVGLLENLYTDNWEIITVDANGCTDTVDVFIDNVGTFEASAVSSNDWCAQGVGSIDLTVTGGGPSFSFDWDSGATTEDISGLTAGTYICTITDEDFPGGCDVDIEVIVTDSTDIVVSGTATDELCDGDNGEIDVTVVGETDLDFLWDNGETTEDLTGLTSGTYVITVTSNVTGCQEVLSFDIINDPDFTVDVAVTDEFCLDSMGMIDLTITGGATMTFEWSNSETTEDLTGLTSGIYSCVITNTATGCTDTIEATIVNVSSGVTASGEVTGELCEGSNGAIDLTVTGGVGPYSYEWSNGETTEDLTDISAGDYTVIVTDESDGCQIILEFTVTNEFTFEAEVTEVIGAACADCPTGSIDISINEFISDAPYTFEWDNGETTEDIGDLIPGTYTVIVTSASGCTDTLVVVVHDAHTNSISEQNNDWLIDLYPNPTMDQVTVFYDFQGEHDIVLNMTNTLGELVRTKLIANSKGSLEMGLEDLESGIYFIHLANENTSHTVKLIIAR